MTKEEPRMVHVLRAIVDLRATRKQVAAMVERGELEGRMMNGDLHVTQASLDRLLGQRRQDIQQRVEALKAAKSTGSRRGPSRQMLEYEHAAERLIASIQAKQHLAPELRAEIVADIRDLVRESYAQEEKARAVLEDAVVLGEEEEAEK